MDPLAVAVAYVTLGAGAFFWSAYARALGLSVPRWLFLAWPVAPILVLWVLHRKLEVYFARGIAEERKLTARTDMRKIWDQRDED